MTLAEGTRSLAAYIGIRRETPDELQARRIELARRQEVASRHLEQTTGAGVFIDDPEDELYLEEHRERLQRELMQIAAESRRATSPRTELVIGLNPGREVALVLPEAIASPLKTIGKVVRIQTETPARAARRRLSLREEATNVVASYERWDDFLHNELDPDERDEAERETASLRARRDRLIPEVLKGPTIRTEIVLFGGRLLGRFGRITLYEDTRVNTPRLEPVRTGRVHPVPEG